MDLRDGSFGGVISCHTVIPHLCQPQIVTFVNVSASQADLIGNLGSQTVDPRLICDDMGMSHGIVDFRRET